MFAERPLFVDQFRRMAPHEPANVASAFVDRLLTASLVYHVSLATLCAVLGALVLYGRNRARVLLTVVLTLGIAGTAFSFSLATPTPLLYKSLNVVWWLLGVGTLAVLWGPDSARQFFRSS
jgi:hypothetical protein